MKNDIFQYATENYRLFGLSSRPKNILYLIKNKYRKVTFFLFKEGSGLPFATAKFTPFPRDKSEITKEFDNIILVNSKLPIELHGTVPKPVSLARIKKFPVLFQSYIQEQPISSEVNSPSRNKVLRKNFQLISDWLVDFDKCMAKESVDGNKLKRMIELPVKQLVQSDSSFTEKRFESLMKYGAKGINIIPGPKHSDFWPGNIVIKNGTPRILDWEDFGLTSLPLYDLFHFMVSYFTIMSVGLKNDEQKFKKIFFSPSKHSRMIKDIVIRHCDSMDTSPDLAELFFALYLVEFHNIRRLQEGDSYDVALRYKKFIRVFLENRETFILGKTNIGR